jgi:hypothetical protein
MPVLPKVLLKPGRTLVFDDRMIPIEKNDQKQHTQSVTSIVTDVITPYVTYLITEYIAFCFWI